MEKSIDEIRKQKRRLRRVRELAIVFIVVLAAVFLAVNKDRWFPKLEGIGGKYEDAITGNGKGDSFPISISGGIEYHTGICDGHFVILGDTSFKVFSQDGVMTGNFQHAYANPVLKCADKRVLVYDLGGTKFRVDSKNKSIYAKELDSTIFFARISDDGYAAVVTSSDMYVCVLSVFDDKGVNIYKRGCTDRITDVYFTESSLGCYAVSVSADDGRLLSTVKRFDFANQSDSGESSDGDEQTGSEALASIPTLAIESVFFSDGGFFIIGDTMAAYYDSEGALKSQYDYDHALLDYSVDGSGNAALLFDSDDLRCAKLVLLSGNGGNPVSLLLPQEVKSVYLSNGEVYMCVDGSVTAYSLDGKQTKRFSIEGNFGDLLKIGDYIYLLGYDKIERVDCVASVATGYAQMKGY